MAPSVGLEDIGRRNIISLTLSFKSLTQLRTRSRKDALSIERVDTQRLNKWSSLNNARHSSSLATVYLRYMHQPITTTNTTSKVTRTRART